MSSSIVVTTTTTTTTTNYVTFSTLEIPFSDTDSNVSENLVEGLWKCPNFSGTSWPVEVAANFLLDRLVPLVREILKNIHRFSPEPFHSNLHTTILSRRGTSSTEK
jgi:hypothetical protein